MIEVKAKTACNGMSNSVADTLPGDLAVAHARPDGSDWSLYARDEERKYLNRSERERALAAAGSLPSEKALFILILAWTGARVNEVLALTPASFQIELGIVELRTLKRRKPQVREVPTIPPEVMQRLDLHFDLSRRRRDPRFADRRLWSWHASTAWRIVKRVMRLAGINGRRARPRGLRHAFGVGTQQAGIPLNITQGWMGHARMTTTAIYTSVCGPEDMAFARQFWQSSRHAP